MITHACITLPDIQGAPESWPLQKIAGLSLIERNLMAVKAQGALQASIVCPSSMREAVAGHLTRLGDDRRLPAWRLEDEGVDELEGVQGPVLRVLGSRLYHNAWIKEALGGGARVSWQKRGQPVGLDVVERMSQKAEAGRELESDGFAVEAALPKQHKAAAREVWRSLIKTSDGWFSVHLNRPISLSFSKIVSRAPIHPNWITLFTFLVGAASAVLSAFGTWIWVAIGGVLYQLASILDGVDGEIARVKYLGSKSGQWMDTICDDTTNAIYIAGVTIGVWRSTGWQWIVWIGAIAVALDVLVVSLLYYQLVVRFKSGTLLGVEWDFQKAGSKTGLPALVARLEPFMKRDLYGLLFMLIAIGGVVWIVPILSAVALVGTLAAFLGQMAKWRARDRAEAGS
ncbi:MAG: CDP-alcohol phosphatidyltransferase family protein [Deltaproteobacteria bacterium]|nr:CDP-alcohol phosphatidyltransferase family protein [Deltaproteobacteria bacterium]